MNLPEKLEGRGEEWGWGRGGGLRGSLWKMGNETDVKIEERILIRKSSEAEGCRRKGWSERKSFYTVSYQICAPGFIMTVDDGSTLAPCGDKTWSSGALPARKTWWGAPQAVAGGIKRCAFQTYYTLVFPPRVRIGHVQVDFSCKG